MIRFARFLIALAVAAAALPSHAAGETPRERVAALAPGELDGLVARFTGLARLESLQPSGTFELRVWRQIASNDFGTLFADGRWRFLESGDVRDNDTRDVMRRAETIVAVKVPGAAVVEATRAAMAFDGRSVSCDNRVDGVLVVVQASVDGHPLLLSAANPGSCRGEMAQRVTRLLDAVDAVQARYRVVHD